MSSVITSKTSEPDDHDDIFAIFGPFDHCAADLFEVLVNSGIGRKKLSFCPTSLASKSFSEHLENSERWSTTSLPHYLQIINSRKCEVCHAKKQGAI